MTPRKWSVTITETRVRAITRIIYADSRRQAIVRADADAQHATNWKEGVVTAEKSTRSVQHTTLKELP